MKKIFTLLTAFVLAGSLLAQAPQSFNYQAVLRDAGGNIIANTQVSMKISILQGSTSGTAVCIEEYTPTTNDFGLVTLAIGSMNTTDFATIDWSAGSYFVKVELDQAGGTNYIEMGTTQLLSVPYALHSKTVENITEADPVFTAHPSSGITSVNITDWTSAYGWGDHSAAGYLTYDPSGWNRKHDTLYYLNGNVGIGTEAPTQKLEVNGNVWANGFNTPNAANYNKFQLMGTVDGYSIGTTSSDNVGFVNTWANAFTWRKAAGYGWIWRTHEGTGLMSLDTEGKLYLKSTAHFAENVGIGTSSPAEKLTLYYNSFIGWEYSGGNPKVAHKIGKSSNGAGPLQFITNYNPGDTGQLFTFYKSGMKPLATILYNGNVGIGTLTPGAKLEVADTPPGGNDPVAIRIKNLRSSTGLYWELRAYDSGAGGPYGRFSVFGGISGGEDKLVVTTSGNVGIGTTDPKSKLQVVDLPEYKDNPAALDAGLTAGAFYRTGDFLKVVH